MKLDRVGALLVAVVTLALSVLVWKLPDSRDALVPALVGLVGTVAVAMRGPLVEREADNERPPAPWDRKEKP